MRPRPYFYGGCGCLPSFSDEAGPAWGGSMAGKGWSKRFDEPIVLDDGTTLTTLREAVEYLAKTVPKEEHNHPSVLNASDHLTRSAEQNYPMFFARAATLQAIHRHRDRVFNPDRNDHHWESANT